MTFVPAGVVDVPPGADPPPTGGDCGTNTDPPPVLIILVIAPSAARKAKVKQIRDNDVIVILLTHILDY
jgi:hypothetical protein